jgi:catechol 2,3-dioxygenase-like lactoylglutathione lyase family enzyme
VTIDRISAITLVTGDMARAVEFYTRLGFQVLYGGAGSDFTSFSVGDGYLNLTRSAGFSSASGWGRLIIYVSDVDAMYERAIAAGLEPETRPRDAEWQERYFHILDADGHELSFAKPLG